MINRSKNRQLISRILTWSSFVIVSLIVIVAFVTATTYIQLAVAIILYPALVYFSFKVFPRKTRSSPLKKPVTANEQQAQPAEKAQTGKREGISITDIDKRAFLKLIGGTGLILFFLSILNKNAGGLFPGIAPAGSGLTLLKDTAGNKIDPAQNQPLDGYRISEVDDSDISFSFYGFINKDGAWFIMKGDADTGSFRYAKGNSNFPNNWARRKDLNYDYFYKLF